MFLFMVTGIFVFGFDQLGRIYRNGGNKEASVLFSFLAVYDSLSALEATPDDYGRVREGREKNKWRWTDFCE